MITVRSKLKAIHLGPKGPSFLAMFTKKESKLSIENIPKDDNPFEMWDDLAEFFQYADDDEDE